LASGGVRGARLSGADQEQPPGADQATVQTLADAMAYRGGAMDMEPPTWGYGVSSTGPSYTGNVARTLLHRAVTRPRTPPKSASPKVIRNGREVVDAAPDEWEPSNQIQHKSSAGSSASGSLSGGKEGSLSGRKEGSPSHRKDRMARLTADYEAAPDPFCRKDMGLKASPSEKHIMEQQLRIEALMEKNQEAGADSDSEGSDWSALASTRPNPTHPKRLQAVFNTFDKDGSGEIDPAELATVLKELNIEKTAEEIEQLMKDADLDGNGVIDFAEFEALFSKARAGSGLAAVFTDSGVFGIFSGGGKKGSGQSSGQR